MQQLYTDNISTQFQTNPNGGDQIAVQVGTFRNDSVLAQAIGIPELKEEESTNFSIGSVIEITDDIHLTVDFYSIEIEDRIVLSNSLKKGLSPALDAALTSSGAAAGQFFLNGADTETEVTDTYTPPNSALGTISPGDVFSEQAISIIEEWQPQDRISVSGLYKIGNFTVNLAFNRFGEYTVLDGDKQTYGAEVLTDLRINYQFNDELSFNFGGNNIFDVYPDKNEIGNSRSGTIVDASGNVVVSSPGVFTYSRRSAPFGFNGAYYYVGAEYRF
jgi:iron complex outermembrane receptor protein